jgi:hypothetical protein
MRPGEEKGGLNPTKICLYANPYTCIPKLGPWRVWEVHPFRVILVHTCFNYVKWCGIVGNGDRKKSYINKVTFRGRGRCSYSCFVKSEMESCCICVWEKKLNIFYGICY